MNAVEILSLLDSLGVAIRVNECGRLAVRPGNRVTPELARRVKAVEPDIRRLLQQRALVEKIRSTFDAKLVSLGAPDPGFEATRCGPLALTPFSCVFCGNDRARCGWCADHSGNPGVISCRDCASGRMKPAPGSWRRDVMPDSHSPLIPDSVHAKIAEIEAEARVAGWTHERLWNAGSWDQPRGLAAVLDEDDEIAEVTADFISVLKHTRSVLRFQKRTS